MIEKTATKYLDPKILKFNNLNIANLDHKDLEFLKSKDLLSFK